MNKQNERISDLSHRLYQASREIRILSHIRWPTEIRETFFKQKEQRLPEVTYPHFEPSNVIMQIAGIQAELGESVVDNWLGRQANIIANSALMKSSVGTEQFYQYSKELYGAPSDPLTDGMSTSLALAHQFDDVIESIGVFADGTVVVQSARQLWVTDAELLNWQPAEDTNITPRWSSSEPVPLNLHEAITQQYRGNGPRP